MNITWKREWKAFDLVRMYNGDLYRIIGIGTDTTTGESSIIYKRADNKGKLLITDRVLFESKVDKEYSQEWYFEKVEE